MLFSIRSKKFWRMIILLTLASSSSDSDELDSDSSRASSPNFCFTAKTLSTPQGKLLLQIIYGFFLNKYSKWLGMWSKGFVYSACGFWADLFTALWMHWMHKWLSINHYSFILVLISLTSIISMRKNIQKNFHTKMRPVCLISINFI